MKIYPTLCLLLMMANTSCNFKEPKKDNKHDIFTDTLVYNYKTIHQRAADCGNKPDSGCTVVNIKFPIFKEQVILNDTVEKRLAGTTGIADRSNANINELAAKFLADYQKDNIRSKGSKTVHKLNLNSKVISQDSGLVAIEINETQNKGGVNGVTYTGFINWNPKTKKVITLTDVFVEGYQEKLRLIAESIFRKEEKLNDTASLVNDYFFNNGKFELNSNYSFNPLSIRFIYNESEIKPYAAGQTELIIPYAQIKSLIRPNSVVAQYIK